MQPQCRRAIHELRAARRAGHRTRRRMDYASLFRMPAHCRSRSFGRNSNGAHAGSTLRVPLPSI